MGGSIMISYWNRTFLELSLQFFLMSLRKKHMHLQKDKCYIRILRNGMLNKWDHQKVSSTYFNMFKSTELCMHKFY